MENIIVTVTNQTKSFQFDVELPATVTMDKLRGDIVEALNGYEPSLRLIAEETGLFSNRIGRQLKSRETLESAGVWDGDYITLIEV